MAQSFGAQLEAFARRTGNKLEEVDRSFKLELFGMIVRATRVADPSSWKPPYTPAPPSFLERVREYKGGTMRGNWQVTTGTPAGNFLEGTRNTGTALPTDEQNKVQPFSSTYLTNNTPYVLVYEEIDGMLGRAIAAARQALEEAVRDA